MPARRRTAGGSSGGEGGPPSISSANSNSDDDSAYKIKRQRNNDAVKKTRAKSKETANERKRNVEKLRLENRGLEDKIKTMEKHVQTLKDLLLSNVRDEDKEKVLQQVLEEENSIDGENPA